ncbi:MAG: polyprenyl synthetase family protein [Candidatus Omnitrophica bacterium]|nr:polyprenyl synthetase family protein [Candidatus Omnitrophota bacterium]
MRKTRNNSYKKVDITKLLKKRKILINKRLAELLPKENAEPKRLHKAMRYSVLSDGKRIRPILAIESCLCCGGKISDVLDAACAIEIVHTFSLIHDDLPSMDDDDYRRGKLTSHKEFDEATAILAGDSLLALAFEILARGKDSETKLNLIKEIATSIGSFGIAGGQCIDVEYEGKAKSPKVVNYINLHKTGIFIKAALKIGAIAAKASHKKIAELEKFGRFIGEAFQIVDDILDNGDSVMLFGEDVAHKKAMLLTKKAKSSLKSFSTEADILREIADYLIARTS